MIKGQSFEVRDNFMHLGALAENTSKDVTIRKALTLRASHQLRNIWNSQFPRKIKIWLCPTAIEPVILYITQGNLG